MRRAIAIAVVAVLGLVAWGASAGAQVTPPAPAEPGAAGRSITVPGAGEVTAVPDTVTVRLGVETEAPSAAAALAQGNEQAAALLELLRSFGLEDRDLQTSGLSLWPVHGEDTSVITGYRVRNVVTAHIRDLDRAGQIIDGAVQAVGDAARIEGVSFSIEEDGALLAQARQLAVEDAQEKAGQLAEAAGVTLGPLRSVAEVGSTGGPEPVPVARDQAAGVPLEPGEQSRRVDVVVVYDIA